MNPETSPLDHHARLIARAEAAREAAVQQARQHAQEARTQRGIVIGILRELGLPEEDYNAERLVLEHVEKLERQLAACSGLLTLEEQRALVHANAELGAALVDTVVHELPPGWEVTRQSAVLTACCWAALRTHDGVEVWLYDDDEVEIDNVGAVLVVDELLAVLQHLRSRRVG